MTEFMLSVLYRYGECVWELIKIGLVVGAAWVAYFIYALKKGIIIISS